jgi:hypothetical protein
VNVNVKEEDFCSISICAKEVEFEISGGMVGGFGVKRRAKILLHRSE